jgi:CHAT domain-containing protein
MLEYYLREDAGAVFVQAPGRPLVVEELPSGAAEVARLLQHWQQALDASAQALQFGQSHLLERLAERSRTILGALYRALVQPLEPYLAEVEAAIVVPYGPLHGVPFHALHDGRRFLLERLEVAVCPSSSLLRLCAARARPDTRTALVVGYSDGGRVPAVLDEARAVATLLPGACFLEAEATREAFETAASEGTYDVVHLAAHAEARLDNPAFAHLRLADGQLSAADVFNLNFQGALVTLSGCETGRAVLAGVDEVVGLSRGFLYAGASRLVQSLWRVEDASTTRLMKAFYRGLRDGVPVGAALRHAQYLVLTDEGAPPYVWAPFQLVGERGKP